MIKEEQLLEQVNLKDRRAFHDLFQKFYPSLVRYAVNFIEIEEAAEDIVQDVFISIWEKEERFLTYNKLRNYLYVSVKNICMNHITHRNVEEKYIDYHKNFEFKDVYQEAEILEEEVYRLLFQTIDELPTRRREIVLLSLDGKKNDEIAEILNISLETVKDQKKKALRYMRKRLGDFIFFFLISRIPLF